MDDVVGVAEGEDRPLARAAPVLRAAAAPRRVAPAQITIGSCRANSLATAALASVEASSATITSYGSSQS